MSNLGLGNQGVITAQYTRTRARDTIPQVLSYAQRLLSDYLITVLYCFSPIRVYIGRVIITPSFSMITGDYR